ETAAHLGSRVRRTPVLDVDVPGCDLPVTLKLEFLQHTSSFKPRGAFANLVARALPPAGRAQPRISPASRPLQAPGPFRQSDRPGPSEGGRRSRIGRQSWGGG